METTQKLYPTAQLVTGLLLIFFALGLLWHAERIANPAWIILNAPPYDSNDNQQGDTISVSGVADGRLYSQPDDDKKFVLLRERRYVWGLQNSPSQTVAPVYGFSLDKSQTHYADELVIEGARVLLREAELMGNMPWQKTLWQPARAETAPQPGDVKIEYEGILADTRLFAAGRFLDGAIGPGGRVFVLSTWSRGKTAEELRPWFWFRKPVCFLLLLIGFMLLYQPVKTVRADLPMFMWFPVSFLAVSILVLLSRHTAPVFWLAPLLTALYFAGRTGYRFWLKKKSASESSSGD